MSKQTINIGRTANDKSGDPLRTAFSKVNDNFTELYTVFTINTITNFTANTISANTIFANSEVIKSQRNL